MDEVTYIDCANHRYSGYYVSALHRHAGRLGLRLHVRHHATGDLQAALTDSTWLGLRSNCPAFEARIGGTRRSFCIDVHDSNRLDAEGQRYGYHLPLLQACDLYFKVNYDPGVIAADPVLAKFAHKITPVGQSIPMPLPWGLVPRMRWWPAPRDGWHWEDCLRNLRHLRHPSAPLSELLTARHKDISVFYVTSYRQGARHAGAEQRRNEVVQILAPSHTSSHAEGAISRSRPGDRPSRTRDRPQTNSIAGAYVGFASSVPLPPHAEPYRVPRLSTAEYARTVARSHIFVYTRGLHDCLSSKLAVALAGGAAVVGESLINRRDWLEGYPHLRCQFGYDSPQAILVRVQELLERSDEAARLARDNRAFFERELSPRAVADRIVGAIRGCGAPQP